jgi:hypothetical protein
MRSAVRLGIGFCLVMLTFWGCAASRDFRDAIPTTINTVEPASGFTKKIAIALTHTAPNDFGRRIGDLYYRSLVDALREQGPRLQLIARADGQWPALLDEIVQEGHRPVEARLLAETARTAGLNGWAWARVENLQPVARKTGLLWFRKERYFIFAELSFSVYDPFTGAKLVDKVVETSIPVSEADYETMKTGKAVAIADIDEAIGDIGAEIGEQAGEVLEDQPWQAAVIGVQGERIFLSAGSSAGLRSGERLAVFAGRRIMEGQDGEQFIVPGPEVGLIKIVQVAEDVSEARIESASGGGRIQVGDIAVAAR